LATELATGRERARAEPVSSTATFRIIRVFILHLPGIFEVSIRVFLSALRGLDAAVAVAGPDVVVRIVVPAVVLGDAVMMMVVVMVVVMGKRRSGAPNRQG
jgi:hypothetical protein